VNDQPFLDRVLDAAHDGVMFFAALAVIVFVAFYVSHYQDPRQQDSPPGELVRTPDDGLISYTSPSGFDAPSGGPWCYVVQKVMVPNKDPKDGAMSMVYARTCEELPMRWLKEEGE